MRSSLRSSALAAVASPRRRLSVDSSRPGDEHLQGPQLAHEVAVAPGRVGLALERSELAAHLAEQVVRAG